MGAAEIAAIYAQPLPALYEGTDHAKEGFYTVGERGYELIHKRTGELFRTPNKTTVTKLDEGDKVYTHSESIQLEKYFEAKKHIENGQ